MLNLDIEIGQSNSLSKLIVMDHSDYDNVKVKNVTMEITPPAFPKVNVTFVPNEVNVYNSILLQTNCERKETLPDGLYTIRYSIQPNLNNFTEKKFFRYEKLKCKYGKILLTLHLEKCCTKLHETLSEIHYAWQLMVGVEAASNDCDFIVAYDLYNKACKILDQIKDCAC